MMTDGLKSSNQQLNCISVFYDDL